MISLPKTFTPDKKTVCVQGLGFVGSAMALAIANAKNREGHPLYNVIGVDVPNDLGYQKVMSINGGKFPFENNDKYSRPLKTPLKTEISGQLLTSMSLR